MAQPTAVSMPQPLAPSLKRHYSNDGPVYASDVPYRQPSQQRPNKLQKHRKGAPPPAHDTVMRRTASLDISSLSDNSHRALVNARITVSSRYQPRYQPPTQKAVLKKRRDSRISRTYEAVPSPAPAPQPTWHQPPDDFPEPRHNRRIEKPLPDPYQDHDSPYDGIEQVERDQPRVTWAAVDQVIQDSPPEPQRHNRYSHIAPITTTPSYQDPNPKNKPLPETPPAESAFVEQFSPTTTSSHHRRWTITSYNAVPRDVLDDDPSDLVKRESWAPTSTLHVSAPPKPMTIVSNPPSAKVHRLITDLISTQHTYLETLRKTVTNDDVYAPPVNLLLSLLSIIQVSEDFLREMEGDATPLGVANGFLTTCARLEAHLVTWSQEVGEFLNSRSADTQLVDELAPVTPKDKLSKKGRYESSSLKKWKSFFSRKSSESRQAQRQLQTKPVVPDTLWQRSNEGPGLWEMAVLPTQRIMRYAFVFKELLTLIDPRHQDYHTLERAYHAATCIAKKMTRAQQRPSLYSV